MFAAARAPARAAARAAAPLAAALALLVAAPGAPARADSDKPMKMGMGMKMDMDMMGGVDVSTIPRIPPVAGYAAGERIFFLHTEVSDPKIGEIMTEMMGSPVPVVPSLADAPATMTARVFAFTNGIQPEGPRGPLDFQPDVFDAPAGTDAYRPLRVIHLTTWQEGAEPRLLTSAAEVEAAVAAGEIATEDTGIVVNMPFLTWPGGQR